MKLLHLLASPTSTVILGALALTASVPAHAYPIAWTQWTSGNAGNPGSAVGNLDGVIVTYSGQIISVVPNYPSWNPSTSYVGGNVGNAPPSSGGIVKMSGGSTLAESITFSIPVVDPVIAIWSLGAGGNIASFDFTSTEPFSVVAGGRSNEYGGSTITQSGYNVNGAEGNGVIQFIGTYSQIDFTTPKSENWYGFTVGDPAPEPETFSLLGLGLLALPFLRSSLARRRRA